MPYKPHFRVSAIGELGNGNERFQWSINLDRMDDDFIPGLAPNTDVWDDIAQDIVAFHSRAGSRISERARLTEVKVARIGADGKYTEDPYIINVTDTAGGGNVNYGQILPQSAVVVSLVTTRRGPTGKGRFYLPMPVVDLNFDNLMTEPHRDSIEASAATFIEAVGNQPGVDVLGLGVCVASTKGYNTPVSAVRVGRVVDTMRSRRRSLPETYGVPTPVSQG